MFLFKKWTFFYSKKKIWEKYTLFINSWGKLHFAKVFLKTECEYPSIFHSLVFKVQCFSFHEFLKQLLNFRTYIERNSSFFLKRMRKMKWKILKMKSHSCPLIEFHKVLIVWDFMTVTFIIYLTSVQQVIRHFTGMFHSCNDSPANDDY